MSPSRARPPRLDPRCTPTLAGLSAALGLLAFLSLPACTGLAHAPPRLSPTPTAAKPRGLPERPAALQALTAACLEPGWDDADLSLALDRAFDRRDPRCWSAREIALAEWLLAEAEAQRDAPDDGASEERVAARRASAELHARQAELRAHRHAFDDLAALARFTLARSTMQAGDAGATLAHLQQAAEHASLWAASGHAPKALDTIYVTLFARALARWKHQGRRHDFSVAAAAATQLHAREPLRQLLLAGIDPARLAEVADNDEARARLEALARLSAESQQAWGTKVRTLAPKRAKLAETLARAAPGWMAAAPLLLDFLPGEVDGLDDAAAAVLAAPEVVLAYVTGEAHGGVLLITESSREAFTLPGAATLEALVARCNARRPLPSGVRAPAAAPPLPSEERAGVRGDGTPACDSLATVLLKPAADALAKARQVLIIAHGPLHAAPFERLLAEFSVVRVPSLLALAGLRLRAWQERPAPHPAARDLLTRLPAGDRDGRRGGAAARMLLAAGETEVPTDRALSPPGRGLGEGSGRRFGVPLTVPANKNPSPDPSPEPSTPKERAEEVGADAPGD